MIRNNESGRLTMELFTPRPSSAGPYVPPSLERAIAARWRLWVPWVRMHLQRAHQFDPTVDAAVDSPESRRLRQRHTEHILDLMRDGTSMRTIRRHRLDDPRLTDEVRAMLVEAAKARQSKARYRRSEEQWGEDRLATRIRLGPVVGRDSTRGPGSGSPEGTVSQRVWSPTDWRSRERLSAPYATTSAQPKIHRVA